MGPDGGRTARGRRKACLTRVYIIDKAPFTHATVVDGLASALAWKAVQSVGPRSIFATLRFVKSAVVPFNSGVCFLANFGLAVLHLQMF